MEHEAFAHEPGFSAWSRRPPEGTRAGDEPADVVAFGDYPNDAPMLARANDEDGVALVLERLFA